MESPEEIMERIKAAVAGAAPEIAPNPGPGGPDSLVLDHACAVKAAEFLRDDPKLRLDYCSNVTGVDWPERVEKTKVVVKKVVDGEESEVTETREETIPGFLEAVYHLYSVDHRHGPVVIRLRTSDRDASPTVPSLTSVWRSAEFQEREIYDLFGIDFLGHPDLRRILMWDEFEDFPMRKDYVGPDDYDYEPTPHDDVLERVKGNQETREKKPE